MNKAIFLALLLLGSSISAKATTLHRWPIDYFAYPEVSRWFDHASSCGYICRYDGAGNPGGSGHNGTDILGYMSPTYIRAGAVGSLYYRQDSCPNCSYPSCGGGYGNHVRIQHFDGKVTIYAHMYPGTVAWYQTISCGATVGIMGNSGQSTGTHLHLEMWSNKYASQRIDHFGGIYSNGGFSYWVNQNANGYGRPSTSCQ